MDHATLKGVYLCHCNGKHCFNNNITPDYRYDTRDRIDGHKNEIYTYTEVMT